MTNNQATLDKLDRMRLHGMARALRTSLETQSQCTTDELLARLVDAEWDDRHERRLKRLPKAARFRYPAAIEEVKGVARAAHASALLLGRSRTYRTGPAFVGDCGHWMNAAPSWSGTLPRDHSGNIR